MKLDALAVLQRGAPVTLALLALTLGCSDKAGDSASSGTYTLRDPATYIFLASDAEWVAPSGVGKIVPDHPVLIGVQDNGPSLHLTLAWGDGSYTNPRQNVGRKTLDISAAIDRDGHFEVGPKDIDQEADDGALIIEDFTLRGTIAESAIEEIAVSGFIDAAGFYGAIGLSDADAFCAKMAGYGAACVPCNDGGSRCVPFEAHQAEAAMLPDDFPYYEFASGSWCAGVLVLPLGAMFLRRRKATA